MTAKPDKIDTLTKTVERGFALMEKGFASVAEDIAGIKAELAAFREEVRGEFRTVHTELKTLRIDLENLREKVDNVTGYRKEIDCALKRIAARTSRIVSVRTPCSFPRSTSMLFSCASSTIGVSRSS